jgi:Na+/proline symporter
MVFVFYQFEPAPLNFNPKALEIVRNSYLNNEFTTLELENLNTQKKIRTALLKGSSQEEINQLNKIDLNQRKKAKKIIKAINPKQETNDKDYVFISFVLGHLPTGLIGLLIAVIFSAAMSSTASELSALSATTTVDLYKRNIIGKSESHYVKVSKGFTLVWGLIAVLFASVGNLFENLIQLVNIIGSIFYGTILGIFLVAIFIKKVKGKAIFWAALISEAIIIVIFSKDIVGFLWLNLFGTILTISLGLIFQNFFNKPNGSKD